MGDTALVGDIGGTNSRFGLVTPGTFEIRDIISLRNDDFNSLEAALGSYLKSRDITALAAAAIAVAGPVQGEEVALTNRPWRFTRDGLRKAARAEHLVLLNDYQALALALPHLGANELVQIGGELPASPAVKIVLGPGTGLGMAALVPLPGGGWTVLPGELGHITLPVVTREEFDWRARMSKPDRPFVSENALTGAGLLSMYEALTSDRSYDQPEALLQAALAGSDVAALRTLDQFIVWLARIAGDAAMSLQARGGVYLAGGIVPSLVAKLQSGPFRTVFQEKGRLAYIMRAIPVYVILDPFAALKGCAGAAAK